MHDGWQLALADGRLARARFSRRPDGDFAVTQEPAGLARARAALVDRPWVWVRQVHGAGVVVVGDDDDPAAVAGAEADAVVTGRDDVAVSVYVADCAPVALASPQGVIAAVHAGWKGLAAGVVEAAVDAMRRAGAHEVEAFLGPCIHPECYEFGADELAALEAELGPAVRARTSEGAPALDLPAAVAVALGRAGVPLAASADECTACASGRAAEPGADFYSHRARSDTGRHALAVWIERLGG